MTDKLLAKFIFELKKRQNEVAASIAEHNDGSVKFIKMSGEYLGLKTVESLAIEIFGGEEDET